MLRSFKFTIILLFLTLILIITTAITINLYHRSKQVVLELSNHFLDATNHHVIDITVRLFNMIDNDLKLMANILKNQDYSKNKHIISEYMWTMNQKTDYYTSVYTSDKIGNFYQSLKEPNLATRYINAYNPNRQYWFYRAKNYNVISNLSKEENYNPLKHPWYLETINKQKAHYTNAYIFKNNKILGITASYPIIDDKNIFRGVIAIDMSLECLSRFISEQAVSSYGIMLILNERDEVVALPSKLTDYKYQHKKNLYSINNLKYSWINSVYQFKKKLLTKKEQNRIILNLVNVDDKNYFVRLTHFPENIQKNWRLLVIVPESSLLNKVNNSLYSSVVLSIIFIIITIFMVFIISTQLSEPIKRLVYNTKLLQNYKFDELEPIDSYCTEIKIMDKALNDLSRRLVAFKKYVPTELVKQMMVQKDGLKLGGKNKEIVLFSAKIANFNQILKELSPEEQILYVSRYQSEIGRVLLHEDATIDKYLGEVIGAFWGAPMKRANMAYLACRSSLECEDAIAQLNKNLRKEEQPQMSIQIGLHQGDAIVGNFGSEDYMVYSAIGNNVNFAQGLEEFNKRYGTNIIISETIYQQIHHDFLCRFLDIIPVTDYPDGLKIYELIASYDSTLAIEKESFVIKYEHSLQHFLDGDYHKAQTIITELQENHPEDKSITYLLDIILEELKKG
jgi:adenylate cyclase